MLLHDYLRRKAAIINKAQAEVKNLLTEISDVKTRAIVDDWEPGDPITDEYPQVDQKPGETPDDKPKAEVSDGKPAGLALSTEVGEQPVKSVGQPSAIPGANLSAATNEPAQGTGPAGEPAVAEDNTNHTV